MEYFSKFGKVLDANVVYDSSSKRPGGFGFVCFSKKPEENILDIDHLIKNSKVKEKYLI